jgi:MFS family permease
MYWSNELDLIVLPTETAADSAQVSPEWMDASPGVGSQTVTSPAASSPTTSPSSASSPPEPPLGEEPTTGGYRDLLKNGNFLALWSGQVFSQLADKVFLVLIVALIATHVQAVEGSVSRWVSAVMVAFTIPAVLFGSLAGVFVDRWPKKWVMVGTNLVRGSLVLAIPLLLGASQHWSSTHGLPWGFLALLGVTFAVSTLTQFFAPAEQTAIPLIVQSRHLLAANSLYTTTMMASVIVGFAIGEPLLMAANRLFGWLGFGPELGSEVAVGSGYLLAGVILTVMATGERDRQRDEPDNHVWDDLKAGLQYLAATRRVRGATIQLVSLFSIFAALAVLSVRQAELMPALNPSQFGFLLAAAGIGMVAGALTVGQWGKRVNRSVWSTSGLVGVTLALVLLSFFADRLWPSLAIIAGLGMAGAMVGVPMQTTIQETTPPDLRGKVFGLQNNFVNIALSLPLALASVAESHFGLRIVLWGLAAIALLTGLVAWGLVGSADEPTTGEPVGDG